MVSKVTIDNLSDVSNAFQKKILVDNLPDVQQIYCYNNNNYYYYYYYYYYYLLLLLLSWKKKAKPKYKLCVDNDMLGENSNLD